VSTPRVWTRCSFPGMMITYRLIERLEQLSETNPSVRIVNKARVTRLLTGPDGSVVGVEYDVDGTLYSARGPVRDVSSVRRRIALCCAVLCCAVLCCAVLCCAVLCCAVLCCAVLCCFASCGVVWCDVM
jgi:hypothetical protein